MDPIKLTVGEILGEARELFSANLTLCVGSAAAIMFGFTLLDMSGASAASAQTVRRNMFLSPGGAEMHRSIARPMPARKPLFCKENSRRCGRDA